MTIFQSSAYFESFGITPLWYEKNPLRIPYEKMRGGGCLLKVLCCGAKM